MEDCTVSNLQSRTATDAALKALLARGIPTFAASGDDGARDDDPGHNRGRNADYPAASPYSFGKLHTCLFVF
jgi:subtilase family serine protease